MTDRAAHYHGYRFPPEIISHAVWLYHRFCLSFRDAEDLDDGEFSVVLHTLRTGVALTRPEPVPQVHSAAGHTMTFNRSTHHEFRNLPRRIRRTRVTPPSASDTA